MLRDDSGQDYERVLREGIRAAQDGSKNLAWTLLKQASQMRPHEVQPWLWMTETTDDPGEKEEYLERALALDPRNIAARRGLEKIRGENSKQPLFQPDEISLKRETDEPVVAKTKETFSCPNCGAPLEYLLQANALSCLHCGLVQEITERSAVDDEQDMARILPTERGHRWAASQHQMVCEQCGAHSLWAIGQTAAECPYCGSRQLLESEETQGLVDPHGIAIMKVNESQAMESVLQWLGKGWTVPDDLMEAARRSLLRSAYYPFWTFDGTAEMSWTGYVDQGYGDNHNWVKREGTEYEMFDDVLVPGLTSFKFKTLNNLGDFYIKDIVEFKPEYLAGWPAMTYDRPLAKATLLAREQIARKLRREINSRALQGRYKRDFRAGNLNWSDMTFKHILLPLWIGTYRYKGGEYPVMINGQTGKVTGEKPRDTFKVFGIIVSIIVTIIVLGLIGVIVASMTGWI
jgi:DNA-directed RNA polymerase subunit RPC12/RpoP